MFKPLLFAYAVREVIHRAAGPFASHIPAAEIDAEHILGIVGHHTEKRRYPHPEHRAGSAYADCRRNARDVARADCGRESGAHRLKRRNGALAVGMRVLGEQLAYGLVPPVGEVRYLEKAGKHRHKHARAYKQHKTERAPDKAVDHVVTLRNLFK